MCLNNFSYYGCFQDSFSKQYEVCSKALDALNDVILEKGDIVDVLDRTKSSHWLVRKDSATNEVSCNLYIYLYWILKQKLNIICNLIKVTNVRVLFSDETDIIQGLYSLVEQIFI